MSAMCGIWTEAKFLVPAWEDIVDSGIGLSDRPASLCSLAGQYDNPMQESTISPQSGTKNLDKVCYEKDSAKIRGVYRGMC